MTFKRIYIDDKEQPFAGCFNIKKSIPTLILNELYLKGWDNYNSWITRKVIIRHEIMHYKQWQRNPYKFENPNIISLFCNEVEASFGAISKYTLYKKAKLLFPIIHTAVKSCLGFYEIRRRNL